MKNANQFADIGVFQLFDRIGSTVADAILGEIQKWKSRSLMLGGSKTHSTALFQADMPLIVALLAVILVNSSRWSAEIHPARILPHGYRTELVRRIVFKSYRA